MCWQSFPIAANLKVRLCPSAPLEGGLVSSHCSKSPKCGVSLPFMTEFNLNQEIHLNARPLSSRTAASRWNNAQLWHQKSRFILRRPGHSDMPNLCQAGQRVLTELDNRLDEKTCHRPAEVMSSLLTTDQSVKALSMQGASLQTVSLIDICRTSRSSSRVWVYETLRQPEIMLDLAGRWLRLLFEQRILRLTSKCKKHLEPLATSSLCVWLACLLASHFLSLFLICSACHLSVGL